jgi:hypothetical protein
VVFLADPERGHSLYYAHLDRQTVAAGQRVRAGDTVGFVGNTGNARTTAPHLHFGVYRAGEGAVDPFPYVDTRRPPPARSTRATPPSSGGSPGHAARWRSMPARARGPRRWPRSRPRPWWRWTGRPAPGWLRVRLPDLRTGYVPAPSMESVERPVTREVVAAGRPVRARPAAGSPPLAVTAGGPLPVYGRFGAYRWVEVEGRRGWAEGD